MEIGLERILRLEGPRLGDSAAMSSITAESVSQRSKGYSKDMGRMCPISSVVLKCLKDKLTLNGRYCITDQMPNAFGLHRGKSRRWGWIARYWGGLVAFVSRH